MAFRALNTAPVLSPVPTLEAFQDQPKLHAQLRNSLEAHPDLESLFVSVNAYVSSLKTELERARRQGAASAAPVKEEPVAKKRKLDVTNGAALPQRNGSGDQWLQRPCTFKIPDVSFSTPVRKKLTVEIVGDGEGGLRAIDTKTGNVETYMSWADVDQVISTPVPDKATPARYIVLVSHDVAKDALVLTLPETPAKNVECSVPVGFSISETKYPECLSLYLHSINRPVITADPNEFLSSQTQPHRSAEKPAHVKAFRGSKEGFLLFLKPGILFGFKKPMLWFPYSRILAVSYQSVLQRTFNMVIAAEGVEESKAGREEYEFSMIDQVDFAGIDEYVKRHRLNDESLAESRKAKVYGVNDPRSRKRKADAEDGQGEVQAEESKPLTEQEIQDAEDEEEEDFDPGSEGDSDGSGEDSEEEVGGGDEEVEAEYEDDEDE